MGIARDSLAYGIAQIVNLATATLTSAVVAVCLGREMRGVLVATLLINTLTVTLLNFGSSSAASYFIGRDRDRLARIHTLLVVFVAAIACVEIALWAIFGSWLYEELLRPAQVSSVHMIVMLAIIPGTLYFLAGHGLMIGLGRVRALSRFSLYLTFAQNLLSVIGMLWLDWQVRGVLAVFVVGQIGGAVSMHLMLRSSGSLWSSIKWGEALAELREMASYGMRVFYGAFAGIVVNRFDQVFIISAMGAAGIGVYNLSSKLANLVAQFAVSLESGGYSRVRKATEASEAAYLARELFRTTFFLSAAIVVGLMFIARPMVLLLYTVEFADAIAPMLILLPGSLCLSCSRMLTLYFSAHLGRPQISSNVTWVVALIYMPTIWWVVIKREEGLLGAAWVTTGSYGLMLIGLLVLFIRWTGLWNPLPYFIPQPSDFTRAVRLIRGLIQRRGA
jgi:O-antigen/teichoic acid export membrane protein